MSGREGNWTNEGPYVLAELQNLRCVVNDSATKLAAQQQTINAMKQELRNAMAAIDDLTAQVAATDATLDSLAILVPQIQAIVSSLQEQIANAPTDTAALTALAETLKTHTDAAAAVLPTPVEPPAPTA